MAMASDPGQSQPIASPDDYRLALLAIRNTGAAADSWARWVEMLECQYGMPDHRITATQFAERIGLSSYGEANLNYGRLAHAVANQLRYRPPNRPHGDRQPMWWMALSSGKWGEDEDGHFEFTMHPALAEALETMGWVKPRGGEEK